MNGHRHQLGITLRHSVPFRYVPLPPEAPIFWYPKIPSQFRCPNFAGTAVATVHSSSIGWSYLFVARMGVQLAVTARGGSMFLLYSKSTFPCILAYLFISRSPFTFISSRLRDETRRRALLSKKNRWRTWTVGPGIIPFVAIVLLIWHVSSSLVWSAVRSIKVIFRPKIDLKQRICEVEKPCCYA